MCAGGGVGGVGGGDASPIFIIARVAGFVVVIVQYYCTINSSWHHSISSVVYNSYDTCTSIVL